MRSNGSARVWTDDGPLPYAGLGSGDGAGGRACDLGGRSRRGDSNPQPTHYKCGALPVAPRRRTSTVEPYESYAAPAAPRRTVPIQSELRTNVPYCEPPAWHRPPRTSRLTALPRPFVGRAPFTRTVRHVPAGGRMHFIMATVSYRDASRFYPGSTKPAVDNLNLEIGDGEFLVLVGPSGCGKSTSLRMLAGLEDVDTGAIYIDDRDVTNLPPKSRHIAMVFQHYALYPHMTVYENTAFALTLRKTPKHEIDSSVKSAAKLLQLEEYLNRKPKALSGGQRQRVAMGRAIVREPQVFLMDEPLSNLDAKLRVQTRSQIATLQAKLDVTTVYVTHDQIEAMTMGHRVAVLRDGELQQIDTPRVLYDTPGNVFAAGFVGSPPINLVDCNLRDGNILDAGSFQIPVPERFVPSLKQESTQQFVLGIRPQDLRVNTTPPSEADGVILYRFPSPSVPAEIYTTEPLGDSTILD